MTEREMRDLIIQHKVLLEYQKNRIVNDALMALLEALPELKSVIDFINKNNYTRLRKEEEQEVNKILQSSFSNATAVFVGSILTLSKYEQTFQYDLLSSLITEKPKEVGLKIQPVSKGVVNTILFDDPLLGETFDKALIHQSAELQQALKITLLNGIKAGKNPEMMANDMRKNFNVIQPRLDTLMRTSTSNVMNITNNNTFMDADFIEYVKYSAILDSRTTDICRGRNGKVYKKETSRGMIPAHYNCRSFFIPIIDKNFQLPENYSMWQKLQDKSKNFLRSDDPEALDIGKKKQMTIEQMKRIEK